MKQLFLLLVLVAAAGCSSRRAILEATANVQDAAHSVIERVQPATIGQRELNAEDAAFIVDAQRFIIDQVQGVAIATTGVKDEPGVWDRIGSFMLWALGWLAVLGVIVLACLVLWRMATVRAAVAGVAAPVRWLLARARQLGGGKAKG